eukprot:CAMPEP_0185708256 /NCGR_PEP_ID=MMETSP1164-20130828/26155_1 /TAXON_ID=1104430 /ORGANISM="Chrysoreinhardia sp, Strain CCMP2950" /LENGTH=141 /DNA_ID=CAMNT_0028375701 /DNA_START=85 /DNA_END=506 /DNA_ORIENTATION=-
MALEGEDHDDTAQGLLDRRVRLRFPAPRVPVVAHGLAGYFDADLYADVTISIHPASRSEGMFSWFPLFLPFSAPVPLEPSSSSSDGEGDDVEAHSKKTSTGLVVDLWRRSDDVRVWYEWAVVAPVRLPIQNPNGRSYAMLL